MLSVSVSEVDQLTAELSALVARVQRVAARATDGAADCAVAALQAADRLTAAAAGVVARGGFESGAGLPPAIVLQMDARLTGWDARAFTRTAAALVAMPNVRDALEDGVLSWSQVRAIVAAVKSCDGEARAQIDRRIGCRSLFQTDTDPDGIVREADDLAADARRDLAQRREQRAIDRSFVAFQPMLDGRASFYGEGDAESVATLVNALDAIADRPASAGRADAPNRAQQRYEALIALAERGLAGGGSTRPRPRVLAAVDIARGEPSARVLWALAGDAPRLSPIGAETLLCDADVLPVLFRTGAPVAVGDARSPIPAKIRRAVEARDRGCRFPGCRAPLAWTDAHHILPRIRGGTSRPENLVMLCRRCHRRVHQKGWRITVDEGGAFEFARRGHRYRSPP